MLFQEEKKYDFRIIKDSFAMINTNWAVQLLQQYCRCLPRDELTNNKPKFTFYETT